MSADDPFGLARIRASVLAAWRDSPNRFREDANAEEDLRLGGYRDRWLVELAQNAADAAAASGAPGTLRLSVSDNEIRVANTGAPLTPSGAAALATLRASAKRAGDSVGRFGVGFAAVLGISANPRVVTRHDDGVVGVAFAEDRTRAAVAELPELADELARRGDTVPILRLPWTSPADEPPPPTGFTTEIRLPLSAGLSPAGLLTEHTGEIPDLLLALPWLSRVELPDATWTRETVGDNELLISGPDGARRWLTHRCSGELSQSALTGLGVEARERPEWTVCWAVRLRDEPGEVLVEPVTDDVLHVPTPTDERLSLPARLLASLPLEPSRRRIRPGPATDEVLAAAAAAYPGLVRSLPMARRTALVPLPGFPASDVDETLRAGVIRALADDPWLSTAAGGPVRPARAQVLDVHAPELVDPLTDVLDGLLPAELSLKVHAPALSAVGVRRSRLTDVLAALAGVRREPSWWSALYTALAPMIEAEVGGTEELAALPVPLIDGRTVVGPKGALVPADPELAALVATAGVIGLRVIHPAAVHPLLIRAGAVRAGATELLDSEPIRAAVGRSVDDARAGADPDELAEVILRLLADAAPADRPWLGELCLRDVDGEPTHADELIHPDSPLRALIAEDVGLAVLHERHMSHPREILTAVGVTDGFTVITDEEPIDADHDLIDERAWWDQLPRPPARLVAIRDLDLIDDDRWPEALRLLTETPETRRVLADPHGHTAWWLGRNALLAGHPPRWWRTPEATELAGLFDPVPETGLPPAVLAELGVRTSARIADARDAADVLARLSRPGDIPVPTILRAHDAIVIAAEDGRLVIDDLPPPAMIRTLTGALVPADDPDLTVLDAPHHLAVCRPDKTVSHGRFDAADILIRVLDLGGFGETFLPEITSTGRPGAWDELEGIAEACAFLGVEVPDSMITIHDELLIDVDGVVNSAPWYHDHDGAHARDAVFALARALAWTLGRWERRQLIADLIADPTAGTLLG